MNIVCLKQKIETSHPSAINIHGIGCIKLHQDSHNIENEISSSFHGFLPWSFFIKDNVRFHLSIKKQTKKNVN